MPYFICPSCAWRGTQSSRTAGFSDRPVSCERCGFGFLFELMDDYFPSPLTGIFVCDQSARIIALGRGARELSGYSEEEIMGLPLVDALQLSFSDKAGAPAADLPHITALEWGARVLEQALTLTTSTGKLIEVVGDFFPAYDNDGGLLAAFTPRS